MKLEGAAQRLSIYIGENDLWQGVSLAHAIVVKAREMNMAGATVYRGIEGYGAKSRIHTARLIDLSSDLPVVVEIVDKPEKITAFLPVVDEMIKEGLVTVEEVRVLFYHRREQGREKSRQHGREADAHPPKR